MSNSNQASVSADVLCWRKSGAPEPRRDWVAHEEPLEIRVRGRSIAVTMRTPGNDNELAAGFLLTEGLIHRKQDVIEVAYCQQGEAAQFQNTLNVFLAPSIDVQFEELTRHVFASSSCGLCGKASIEAVHQHFRPVNASCPVRGETLLLLPERARVAQEAFNQTGGLHAAALFSPNGDLIVLREDVGRHNAVDKVVGHGLLEDKLPLDQHILFVSGRASFEIMQKALGARIAIVAAVSAPSSLAIQFAKESGQTLIGFLRGAGFNIYSHPERIVH